MKIREINIENLESLLAASEMNGMEREAQEFLRKMFDDRTVLLEALQYVMSAHGEQLTDAFDQAHRAIAKATGEAT